MSTILVVDCRSRSLKVFVASATKPEWAPEGTWAPMPVILRIAADVGNLADVCEQKVDSPILVVGEYQARSSAGFTAVYGGEKFRPATWVGGAGFGRKIWDEESQKEKAIGYGLRPFAYPVTGVLLPAGCRIESVPTHGNSNRDTADAAVFGLRLRAKAPRTIILAEGQSDSVCGYKISAPESAETVDFPAEFRGEMFSQENIFEKIVFGRYQRPWTEGEKGNCRHKIKVAIATGETVPGSSQGNLRKIFYDWNKIRELGEHKLAELDSVVIPTTPEEKFRMLCEEQAEAEVTLDFTLKVIPCKSGVTRFRDEHFPGRDSVTVRELLRVLHVDDRVRKVLERKLGITEEKPNS